MNDQAAELGIQISANGQDQPAMTPQTGKHLAALARAEAAVGDGVARAINPLT
jgi:hypothetical protein